jgi:hypothetical protein
VVTPEAVRSERRFLRPAGVEAAKIVIGALLALALASCGGSSSETPPPLEPVPANVHYDRAATTLPGEIGTPTRAPAPPPSAKPAPTPFHPTKH